MSQSVQEGDLRVTGTLSARTLVIGDGSITDAKVQAAAAIAATKLEHQFPLVAELFAPATTIAAATRILHLARGVGEVVAVEAIVQTPATGADRTVTVDLKKGNTASAYATLLSATIGFTNASTARTPVAGTISSGDYAADDSLQVVVTVAGAAGNQAIGLTVVVWCRELPD